MANELDVPGNNFWLRPNPRYEASAPIAALWLRLAAKFGVAWTSAFVGESSEETARLRSAWEREWADAFTKAGIKPAQVRVALYGCNRLRKAPGLGEFLALAAPVPDAEMAFREAVRNLAAMRYGEPFAWSHPAVYWAAMALGADEVRQHSWTVMAVGWRRCLSEQLRRSDWPPVPEYQPGPSLRPVSRDRVAGRRRLDALRELLDLPADERHRRIEAAAAEIGRAA